MHTRNHNVEVTIKRKQAFAATTKERAKAIAFTAIAKERIG